MVALHRLLYKVYFHLGGERGGRVSARGSCLPPLATPLVGGNLDA